MLLEQWDDEMAQKVWREEAIETGMEEGAIKCARKIAKNMKNKGMDVNEIMWYTGLSVEDVLKL